MGPELTRVLAQAAADQRRDSRVVLESSREIRGCTFKFNIVGLE